VVYYIGDDLEGILILNAYYGLSAAIRHSLLHAPQKSNEEIHTKLSLGYGKDALCQHTVDTWTARFQGERISAKENERPGRAFRDDFLAPVSGY
jgi:hypothetical protein